MYSSIRNALLATLTCAAVAGAQTQAGAAATVYPEVGHAAPAFTATATDSTGKTIPLTLAGLRGKVVVLAFYPGDRTRGCTAELTKFRDEYTTMFGKDVVVLPTSVDSLGSHSSWAKDAHFPFEMIADTQSQLSTMYGSQGLNGRKQFQRTVFVIGKDGNIVYTDTKFNALAQDGYDKLSAAIKSARGM